MAGLYMGPSSAFGGAFGGGSTLPSGPDNPPARGGGDVKQTPTDRWPWLPGGGAKTPNQPLLPANPAQPVLPPQRNVLGPTAVRASGPSQGFDPSYLQNLATAIGGLFSNSQGGNTMNINPLGNLSEISGSSGMEGNAPQQGLPLTWLQQALNGLGFSFAPPKPPVVTPPRPRPVGGSGGRGEGGGGGGGGGPRMMM